MRTTWGVGRRVKALRAFRPEIWSWVRGQVRGRAGHALTPNTIFRPGAHVSALRYTSAPARAPTQVVEPYSSDHRKVQHTNKTRALLQPQTAKYAVDSEFMDEPLPSQTPANTTILRPDIKVEWLERQ